MSNMPALLKFETHDVRVIDRDGEPWWVLADICAVLEIGNASDTARRLDGDERGIVTIDTPSAPQDMVIISEPGLYKVLMASRKPAAKRLWRWVCHEVLPQIRKTGSYGAHVEPAATQIIEGLKEALRPLAIRFDGQDQAIERIEDRLDDVSTDVEVIKKAVIKGFGGRRRLSEATKRQHIHDVSELGGRCPCCSRAAVVVEGVKSHFAEYDHFYQNSQADGAHTWLICKPCHSDFSNGRKLRDDYKDVFAAYQRQRRQLPGRQPTLF
jgi:prophage antirepressor-like protein